MHPVITLVSPSLRCSAHWLLTHIHWLVPPCHQSAAVKDTIVTMLLNPTETHLDLTFPAPFSPLGIPCVTALFSVHSCTLRGDGGRTSGLFCQETLERCFLLLLYGEMVMGADERPMPFSSG